MLDTSKPVMFRNARKCKNPKINGTASNGHLHIEYIGQDGQIVISSRYSDGRVGTIDSDLDIINIPEKRAARTVFVNHYEEFSQAHETLDQAKAEAGKTCEEVGVEYREVLPDDELVQVGWRIKSGDEGFTTVRYSQNTLDWIPVYAYKMDLK